MKAFLQMSPKKCALSRTTQTIVLKRIHEAPGLVVSKLFGARTLGHGQFFYTDVSINGRVEASGLLSQDKLKPN